MKSLRRIVMFVSSFALSISFMPSIANAVELEVKDGRECKNVLIGGLPELNRLYVWDEATGKLVHFRCVRNDYKAPGGGFASCGSKQNKKFLVPNRGPKCVWKKTINSKSKKPSEYEYNFNVGESCLDEDGYRRDSFLVYVKDKKIVFLRCNNGVWVQDANGQESGRSSTSPSSGGTSSGSSKNLGNVCAYFADSLVAYGRTSRYATSLYEMQLATRKLTQASSAIQDLARSDKALAPLNTSVGILLRHVQSQAPGGSGTPVNSDVLRMAVDSFNSFCGTSIYVTP